MRRIVIGSALVAVVAGMVSLPANALADTSARTTVTETTTTGPSGTFTVVSEEQRSFRLGSDPKVYIAPSDADLVALKGQNVRVMVDPAGKVSKVTRVERTETVEED